MDLERRKEAYDWFEQQTELPLLILSLLIIPLLFVQLLVSVPNSVDLTLFSIDWFIWAVFAMELSVKTYLAPRRRHHLLTHWYEIVIVAVPFLRPLRVMRSARALRSLRASRAFVFGTEAATNSKQLLRQHGLQYAFLLGGAVFVACAVAVYAFEREGGGNISDFGTALWWATGTVTTQGSDKSPVTPEGRGVAVLLMFVGAALFSLLTANIAAFLVSADRDERSDEPTLTQLMEQLRRMEEQLTQLRVERDASSP